jgi:hypothetical protein
LLFPLSFLLPPLSLLGPVIYFFVFPIILMVGLVRYLGWCLRLRLGMGSKGQRFGFEGGEFGCLLVSEEEGVGERVEEWLLIC